MKPALPHRSGRSALADSAAYRSSRQSAAEAPKARRHWVRWLIVLVIVIAGSIVFVSQRAEAPGATVSDLTKASKAIAKSTVKTTPTTKAVTAVNNCSSNTLDRSVVVSISQRHMWACEAEKTVYDSPVITGMENLAADLTPTGTYQVYGKYTDTTLSGHDSTGSWNDPVSYWMPFLHNQYGSYGFHDATWRDPSAFGNISPDSSDASHGCVELPLATAHWLYGWMQIGDSVTIVS